MHIMNSILVCIICFHSREHLYLLVLLHLVYVSFPSIFSTSLTPSLLYLQLLTWPFITMKCLWFFFVPFLNSAIHFLCYFMLPVIFFLFQEVFSKFRRFFLFLFYLQKKQQLCNIKQTHAQENTFLISITKDSNISPFLYLSHRFVVNIKNYFFTKTFPKLYTTLQA